MKDTYYRTKIKHKNFIMDYGNYYKYPISQSEADAYLQMWITEHKPKNPSEFSISIESKVLDINHGPMSGAEFKPQTAWIQGVNGYVDIYDI